jgi:hypothetical protein
MKITEQNTIHFFAKTIEEYKQEADVFLQKNKGIPHCHFIVTKGFHLIVHLFKLLIIKTRNINTAYQSSCHAYKLYLEYIEQINTHPVVTDLNTMDALQFVIGKTLEGDLHEESNEIDPQVYPLLDTLLIRFPQ